MKNKTTYMIILIVIILLIGAYAYLSFQKSQKRNSEVKNYKKEMFNGIVCEYGCPLKLQLYNNKTELLPNTACVKNCTKSFLVIQKNINITKDELNKDGFITEIEKIISTCKTKSTNMTALEINNTQFFSCAASSLKNMTFKFDYLT